MKIKITEKQALRLNLIKEDFPLNPLTNFESYCNSKLQFINTQYLKITHMAVADILEGQINFEELYNILDAIDSEASTLNNRAYDYIEHLPEDNLDSLIILVNYLGKIQEDGEVLNKQFSELKPLDITNN
jgi:hypothetical protein